MSNWKSQVAGASLLLLAALPASAGTRFIRAAEFGKDWPFTVAGGELGCQPPGRVTFRVNGITYGVNGLARNAGFRSVRPLQKPHEELYRELANALGVPLWEAKKEANLTMPVHPIIDAGLDLC